MFRLGASTRRTHTTGSRPRSQPAAQRSYGAHRKHFTLLKHPQRAESPSAASAAVVAGCKGEGGLIVGVARLDDGGEAGAEAASDSGPDALVMSASGTSMIASAEQAMVTVDSAEVHVDQDGNSVISDLTTQSFFSVDLAQRHRSQ